MMNTITVKYVNGKDYKSFTTDKLVVYFDRLPVEVDGKEFITNEVKLKTVDGGRTSGVESMSVFDNFEVRIRGVSAYIVDGMAKFTADLAVIDFRKGELNVATSEGDVRVGESNAIEFLA